MGSRARLAYLGPVGTFTEAALRTLPAAEQGELYPMPTVAAALDAVRIGEVDNAVVPFENSIEGSVATTLDELAAGDRLQVVGEIVLPVSFSLLVRPGTTLADVTTVATHPHAEAQCRRWLGVTLPDAAVTLVSSTAEAARLVGEGRHDAAVSAPVAAAHYGLTSLVDGVHDNEGAVTRFVVVSRPGPMPAPTGTDRTTLVAYIAEDHPGALLEILTEFAVRGVNLTRIESRPTGSGLGRYCFSVDLEGHVVESRVGEALSALKRVCADVRFLGSYPRADGLAPTTKPGVADGDFTAAASWLARIRSGS
jgi:prephenate dehydratase